jgi:hypothetical protein
MGVVGAGQPSEPSRAEDKLSAWRRSTGQRRLRAHGEDVLRTGDKCGDVGFVYGKRDAGGESTWDVSRVAQKRLNAVRTCIYVGN